MHAQRHVRQRLRHIFRVRQRPQKISAQAIKQIQFAPRAGLHHFRRGKPDPIRDVKTVFCLKASSRFRH